MTARDDDGIFHLSRAERQLEKKLSPPPTTTTCALSLSLFLSYFLAFYRLYSARERSNFCIASAVSCTCIYTRIYTPRHRHRRAKQEPREDAAALAAAAAVACVYKEISVATGNTKSSQTRIYRRAGATRELLYRSICMM